MQVLLIRIFLTTFTKLRVLVDDLYQLPQLFLQDSIISRVAGLACLQVLNGHSGVVSGLVLAETNNHIYLVSPL